jgi:predicted dehydrogenase
MMRVGIVGCGKVAQLHAKALTADYVPDARLAAVTDVLPERARSFAAEYGATAHTTLASMLREIDAVVLCTPHPLHCNAAIEAAKAGVAVLVEKPLAASVADCDAMLEAADRCRVPIGVVSQRRFFEPVRRMREAIGAGKIGTPALGTFLMLSWRDKAYYASDPWRGKWATEGGGVLINQSPHQLDILMWLMGDVAEVQSFWGNLNHPYIEVEDTAVASVKFRNGGLGSITTSLSQKPGIYTKVHIHGSNGASVGVQTDSGATFVAGMSGIAAPPFNDVWTIPGEEHLLAHFEEEDRQAFCGRDATVHYHGLQLRDFCDAVAANRPPSVSGEDGRRVVALIDAIYRSGRTGLSVRP